MPAVNDARVKLVSKLKELFQLDQPELDFGFYRIMHAKSREITAFLDNDLLQQAQSILREYVTEEKAAVKKRLNEIRKWGMRLAPLVDLPIFPEESV